MKRKSKILILIICVSLIIPYFTSCENEKGTYSYSTFALDTICDITFYDVTESESIKYNEEFLSELNRLENLISRTIEGSDIDRINKSSGEDTNVSDDVRDMINLSLEYSRLTDGKFDISIGKVSSLYNFRDGVELPSDRDITDALNHVNYENIKVSGNTVTLLDPDMVLDLGAIAKGYIGSYMADYLESLGVSNALISLGGNIIGLGNKDGTGYNIGVKNPLSEDGSLLGKINGSDITVITSGTYERYIEIDGIKYHHILDTSTGYPANTDLIQATVITNRENGAKADTLSTILLILGSDDALKFMEDIDYAEAILLTKDGDVYLSNSESEFELWN